MAGTELLTHFLDRQKDFVFQISKGWGKEDKQKCEDCYEQMRSSVLVAEENLGKAIDLFAEKAQHDQGALLELNAAHLKFLDEFRAATQNLQIVMEALIHEAFGVKETVQ